MPSSLVNINGTARNPLRDAIAQVVKEFIWRYLIRFQPREKPICIYASRRSGSSLLMEMISTNRGVMFSDQPFSAYVATRANLNRLPIFPYGQIAYPDAVEEQSLRSYVEELLTGQRRANLPWKLWSKEFHFFNDRLCLKITDAKCMMDWIDAQFDVHTIAMTRHPIAQSLSVANAGWFTTGKGLLRNPGYVERWLNSTTEAFAWRIYQHGSDLEQRVMDWVLENLPVFSGLREHSSWLYVSYEDLIGSTSAAVTYLVDRLDLTDGPRMLRRCQRPSRSTRRLSTDQQQRLIDQGKRTELVSSWRDKVVPSEIAGCFEILDQFQIGLYSSDSDQPDHRWLGREPFAT